MDVKNDLKKIRGIGEKRAQTLVDSGISSMNDLAELKKKDLVALGLSKDAINGVFEYFEDFDTVEISSSGKDDKIESQVLEWAAEGYHIKPLEKELDKAKNRKAIIDKYQKWITESRAIRDDIICQNVAEYVDEAEELLDLSFNLEKRDRWQKRYQEFLNKLKARDLRYELEDMRIEPLEDSINELLEQINEADDLDPIIVEVEDLKRVYQEEFFVSEFVKDASDKVERKSVKVSRPVEKTMSKVMPIDDLFLFHGKGMLLMKWYKHKYSPKRGVISARNIVSEIRDHIRSGKKLKPNTPKLIKTSDGTEILLVRGKILLIAAIVSDKISDYGKKVIINSINLIEGVDGDRLKAWDRKEGEPVYTKKVMKALLLLSIRNRTDMGGSKT